MAIEFLTARRLIVLDVADIVAGESDSPASLLDAVRAARLPLGQSCRGEGVCRSCVVDVESGAAALARPGALEQRFGFDGARRLACQVALPPAHATVRLHHPGWGRPPAPASEPAAEPPGGPDGGPDDSLEP